MSGKKKPATSRSVVGRVPRVTGPMADPRVRAWDQLLRDPCAAPLAHPCYAGVDSGYIVRTVDFYQPTFTGTGLTVGPNTMDVIFQVTPFNFSATTGYVTVANLTGGAITPLVNFGMNNFVTSGTVARYRPVAMCVRWIPTGAYSVRAGLVASGYTPGMILSSGAFSGSIGNVASEVQRQAPNGSERHEVRWLPTAVDENFTTTAAASNTGAGSVTFCLAGVDGTNTSATTARTNGQFQITTVWEWLPAGTTGITVSPQPPLPYTSQQVLGTIRDFGAYVYNGVRSASAMVQSLQAGYQVLSGGYGAIERRGSAYPVLRM